MDLDFATPAGGGPPPGFRYPCQWGTAPTLKALANLKFGVLMKVLHEKCLGGQDEAKMYMEEKSKIMALFIACPNAPKRQKAFASSSSSAPPDDGTVMNADDELISGVEAVIEM